MPWLSPILLVSLYHILFRINLFSKHTMFIYSNPQFPFLVCLVWSQINPEYSLRNMGSNEALWLLGNIRSSFQTPNFTSLCKNKTYSHDNPHVFLQGRLLGCSSITNPWLNFTFDTSFLYAPSMSLLMVGRVPPGGCPAPTL